MTTKDASTAVKEVSAVPDAEHNASYTFEDDCRLIDLVHALGHARLIPDTDAFESGLWEDVHKEMNRKVEKGGEKTESSLQSHWYDLRSGYRACRLLYEDATLKWDPSIGLCEPVDDESWNAWLASSSTNRAARKYREHGFPNWLQMEQIMSGTWQEQAKHHDTDLVRRALEVNIEHMEDSGIEWDSSSKEFVQRETPSTGEKRGAETPTDELSGHREKRARTSTVEVLQGTTRIMQVMYNYDALERRTRAIRAVLGSIPHEDFVIVANRFRRDETTADSYLVAVELHDLDLEKSLVERILAEEKNGSTTAADANQEHPVNKVIAEEKASKSARQKNMLRAVENISP